MNCSHLLLQGLLTRCKLPATVHSLLRCVVAVLIIQTSDDLLTNDRTLSLTIPLLWLACSIPCQNTA
jgi:hypothetical protein